MRSILANPMILRAAIVLVIAVFCFLVGAIVIRLVKERVSPEAAVKELRAASGGIEAYHGVITRLKEQEKELSKLRVQERERAAATETISAAVLENLTSGVLLFGATGTVRQANPAAKAILGYASPFGLHARDVFRGSTSVRLQAGEAVRGGDALPQAVELALAGGQSFRRVEAEYTTPAGAHRVLGITISPVTASTGARVGVACLVSDLTEIASLSRQVQLRERQAALGEMSAGIAHEFKNALATISGYAQMLQSEQGDTVRDFAGKIASETSSLTRIVTDFLNFARPQEVDFEAVQLRPLLEDCARECGVSLDLAGVADDFELCGDRTALRQAFSNLLRNSAEAAPQGAHVAVGAEATGDACRVVLRDSCGGIPADVLPKVFIPFFTTKAQGTGLGLALVHRIVTDHSGTIQVASDEGTTTFTLSFPAGNLARKAGNPG